MKWKTPEPRPYYSKYDKLDIRNSKGWFEAYQLPGDIIAICEPQHLQEVNAFLIFGEERALLLDTGMGICDIRPLVEELCGARGMEAPALAATADDAGIVPAPATGVTAARVAPGLPAATEPPAPADRNQIPRDCFPTLQVVNCHCHFDHTGCNWRFDEILGADTPLSRRQAENGVAHGPLANQTDEDMFLFGYPDGFDPADYCIRPYTFRPVPDGHLFDLCGRIIEFITTPGHTEDHAMLYDHRDGILFAGDMIYFGAIYVQFGNDVLGHSDIGDYIASLQKLRARCPGLQSVYVSHNDFITDPAAIDVLIDALTQVRDGTKPGQPLQDEKYGYYLDPPTMRQYLFDGFSIVAAR